MIDNSKSPSEKRSDALLWISVVILMALWVIVLVILFTPEAPNGHGLPHSTYQAMDQGGDGAERHKALLWSGWMFGSLLIAFLVSLLAWGMFRRSSNVETTVANQRTGTALHLWIFLIGGVLYEGVFGMMCLAYGDSLTHPDDVVFLGPFPSSVSWLVFGMWLFPAYFIVLYVVLFDRYIVSPQNIQQVDELVRRTRQNEGPQGTR